MTIRKSPPNDAFMRQAVELSKQGYPAPNPRVGCVVVQGGEIAGEGFHAYAGGPHAEIVALLYAGKKAKGADVYVTLEPCNHNGRTGPCTEALINAGVAQLFFACPDPNPKAAGGAERLAGAGIQVEAGILESEARVANEVWLTAQSLGRPFVVAKAAVSLDGRIALPSGDSKWITGEGARTEGHRLRAELGCVVVGSNTVYMDDPQLTARIEGVTNQPLRVVLDAKAKTTRNAKVFAGGGEALRIVAVGSEKHSYALGMDLKAGPFELEAVLDELWKRGVTGVLVEGGAITLGSFVKANLVDRLELFIAPKLLGSGIPWLEMPGLTSLADAPDYRFADMRRIGADIWITAKR